MLALALDNLISPMVLCFFLGLTAALLRSDLSIPEAVAKGLSIYLLFAIGFKGGAAIANYGADQALILAVLTGVILSFSLPLLAFGLLRSFARHVGPVDAAAVAGHYGSISIVTFVAGSALFSQKGIPAEGFMIAVAAAMEAPAILTALWLAARFGGVGAKLDRETWREILLNGSIVLLLGSFAIGWITGPKGMADLAPLIDAPFRGVLCLFLLDMGLIAGRGLRQARTVLTPGVLAFGLTMPLAGGASGFLAGLSLGLAPGGIAALAILAGSASYIAVPAAMRLALPQANPALYLTLSLCVTFPFNLVAGLPLWAALATRFAGV